MLIAATLLAIAQAAACPAQTSGDSTAACKDTTVADWRSVATQADRERLRGWRDTWIDALDQARKGGAANDVTAGGALFDADRAIADPLPPAGDYRCRIIKLGAKPPASGVFRAFPPTACRIDPDGALLRLTVLTGAQRPVGQLYPDTSARGVFLGTMLLQDEGAPLEYGKDAMRDMAGFVDHPAERQWRIALPRPAFESTIDVIEITSAG